MGLFGNKEKKRQEKLNKEIEKREKIIRGKVAETEKYAQQRQNEIEKLEEEIDKMVKLELKDGKIQKVEETRGIPQAPAPSLAEQAAEDLVNKQMEEMMGQQEMERQRQAFQYQQAQAEQYQREQAAMAQQQMMPQQMAMLQQQQAMAQQAAFAQQQALLAQQQMAAIPEDNRPVVLHILMTEGREAKESIVMADLQQIMDALDEAIASCTTIPFGQRTLNGRYILEYMYYVQQ